MYGTFALIVALLVIAFFLIHFKPTATEGFAVAAVDPARVPACTERSSSAQSLLARFADQPATNESVAELRLLLSKLCCLEADITTPAGVAPRTHRLQFRTSHDMEAASTLVGRCNAGAVPARDVELIMAKFEKRGNELIDDVLSGCPEAQREFANVLSRVEAALKSCVRVAPAMDHPAAPRDLGYWETTSVADLSQYQGISAVPK
jgi:hypothetical protein